MNLAPARWFPQGIVIRRALGPAPSRAVSQLLWSDKDREEWFSLRENHEKADRFGLHQLRNSSSHQFPTCNIQPEFQRMNYTFG